MSHIKKITKIYLLTFMRDIVVLTNHSKMFYSIEFILCSAEMNARMEKGNDNDFTAKREKNK